MIGTKLAQYEITAHLGTGGMGEVYQATDTKLGRSVAIKLLPEAFARDEERSARLDREARLLATLNHPNIAAIYDIEEAGGRHFLVMELVPGETLAHMLKRGPIPVPDALGIALQMSEALEAAHEKGIIHRDLKPANVKITPEGKVKVLDFGLAKSFEANSASASMSNSPTLTMAATQQGMIIGTAAYMSPEQARGRTVDRRTDIFSFGCVLFEMLTGRAAFDGDDVQDILGSVLKTDPDWTRLPADISFTVRKLVQRCLTKDSKQRLQAIGEARITLSSPQSAEDAPGVAAPQGGRVWPWIAVIVLLAVAIPAVWFLKPAPPQSLLTLEIAAPEGNTFATQDVRFVISPDGRHAVYVSRTKEGQLQLGIRTLASGVSTVLAGTEGGTRPFWSPDSRWVGFFSNGKLQKIALDGGRPQVICDSAAGFATWNQDGVILFAEPPKPLQRVSATGGTPTPVLPLDESRHEILQNVPSFLPDGKHFLYDTRTSGTERGIAWASLDGKDRRFLIQNRNSPGSYAINPARGPGWIIYNSGGRLLAQGFDPEKGEMKGEPLMIADSVMTGPTWSTSDTGMISFPHFSQTRRQLTWIRRDGTRIGVLGEAGDITWPIIAPDQKTVVFKEIQGNDLWIFDPARNASSRLTFENSGTNPVWTPDGSHIIYSTIHQRIPYIVERPVNGVGTETILKKFDNTDGRNPTAITSDGHWISYGEGGGGDRHALFISRPEGKIVSFPEPQVDFASISPDGHWVVYATSASSRSEIFVQSSPKEIGGIASVVKFQVSASGGRTPRWRADGKEIFYISPEGMMTSVPVESGPGVFRPGAPKALFDAGEIPNYDVTADGQRFLLPSIAAGTLDTPMTIILNWPQLLRK